MRYESRDWSIEVPDGWSQESEDHCTSFVHQQGVGAFQVSSYRKNEPVTDADLREFAGEVSLAAVSLRNQLSGYYAQISVEGRFWMKWWLHAGRQMIHVTYNCSLADRGREDSEIHGMIESLTPEYDVTAT